MSTALTTTKPLPPSPLAERYPKDLPDWVIYLNTAAWEAAKQSYVLPTPTPEQRAVIAKIRDSFLELLEKPHVKGRSKQAKVVRILPTAEAA
jgi:hypothetical protein